MSTILKTLKKLEEEKSVLERSADLKALVLKDDLAAVLEDDRRPGILWFSVLVVLCLAFAGYWLYVQKAAVPPPPPPAVAQVDPAPAKQTVKPPPPPPASRPKPTGIPLANIPESEGALAPGGGEDFAWEEEELEFEFESGPGFAAPPALLPGEAELPEGELESAAPGPEQAALTEEPAPETEAAAPALPAEIQEIDNLIKSATQLARTEASAPPSPAALAPGGLKVKAIIFFDEESAGNHIVVATPNRGNLKMKVGDEVDGTKLTAIAANRVTFDHEGRAIEIRVGH